MPADLRSPILLLDEQFCDTQTKVEVVTVKVSMETENDEVARRLKIVRGIDRISSSVLAVGPQDASDCSVASELAAWLVFGSKLHSKGSDKRLEKTSKIAN